MPRPPVRRQRKNSFTFKQAAPSPRIPDPSDTRQHLEKKLAGKATGHRNDSDDSEDLVYTKKNARNRKKEIYASGAVVKGDKPGAWPSKTQRTRAMRADTEEILSQRSRSVSRANSVASGKSTPVHGSPEKPDAGKRKSDAQIQLSGSSKKRKVSENATLINGVSKASQVETSVLGAIKPRKRQASILQLLEDENNDSSTLNSDDEQRFLPDEVSTPVHEQQQSATPAAKIYSSIRKRGSDTVAVNVPSASKVQVPDSQPSGDDDQLPLPPPTRTQKRKLSSVAARTQDVDDILAPPQSSDDDSGGEPVAPVKAKTKVTKQRPQALRTEQLRSLMPSKRHQSERPHRQRGEFEIPEDSAPNSDVQSVDEDEEAHSAFLPTRNRKARTRNQAMTKSKPKAQANQTPKKSTTNGIKTKTKIKDNPKSTLNTSSTPTPARLRAPLPLSSSKPRDTIAKSPSIQDTITVMQDKSANTPVPTRTASVAKRGKKQYGGYRQRGAGKENNPISLSGELSGDDGEGVVSPLKVRRVKQHAEAPEVKAWNRKWAGIDDFDLEFEEISASTRSSSPMAR